MIFRVCSRSSSFSFYLLYLCQLFFCKKKIPLRYHTHSHNVVRITFFCTWIVLLSLCTTFHVKHSTETESTERAFVASCDMCVSLFLPACLCMSVCLVDGYVGWRALCSHFHAMHYRKAFASALRTVDNGFMLLLLLLSFSSSLLVLCFWFWCASALPPFLSTSEISIYTLYICIDVGVG